MPAAAKAYATIGTILETSSDGTTYTKLCKIKSYPALGGAPDQLETTDLEDPSQTFVNGVQSMDAMEFTANYTYTSFSAVKTLANTALYYRLTLADGSKATWQGEHTCWVGEGEVNGIIEFTISVAPSTEITIASA